MTPPLIVYGLAFYRADTRCNKCGTEGESELVASKLAWARADTIIAHEKMPYSGDLALNREHVTNRLHCMTRDKEVTLLYAIHREIGRICTRQLGGTVRFASIPVDCRLPTFELILLVVHKELPIPTAIETQAYSDVK